MNVKGKTRAQFPSTWFCAGAPDLALDFSQAPFYPVIMDAWTFRRDID